MTTKENETQTREIYRVTTVEKIDPPEGMPGNNWYRYIIERGKSIIDGIKPGTLKSVTEHAHIVAGDLNSRSLKGGSYYSPGNQQNKKKD